MIEDGTHMSTEHRTLPEKLPAQPHALSLTALSKGSAGPAIEMHVLICQSCVTGLLCQTSLTSGVSHPHKVEERVPAGFALWIFHHVFLFGREFRHLFSSCIPYFHVILSCPHLGT